MSLGAIQGSNVSNGMSLLYSAVTPNSVKTAAVGYHTDKVDLSEDAQNYLKRLVQTDAWADGHGNKGGYAASTTIMQSGGVLDITIDHTSAVRFANSGDVRSFSQAIAERTHINATVDVDGASVGISPLSARIDERGSTRFELTFNGKSFYLGETGPALTGGGMTPTFAGDIIWKYGMDPNMIRDLSGPDARSQPSPIISQHGVLRPIGPGINIGGSSASTFEGHSLTHLSFSLDSQGNLLDPATDDMSHVASTVNITFSIDQFTASASGVGENASASAYLLSTSSYESVDFPEQLPRDVTTVAIPKYVDGQPKIALATDEHAFKNEDIRLDITSIAKYRQLEVAKDLVEALEA